VTTLVNHGGSSTKRNFERHLYIVKETFQPELVVVTVECFLHHVIQDHCKALPLPLVGTVKSFYVRNKLNCSV